MTDITEAERRAKAADILRTLAGTDDPEGAIQSLTDANGPLGTFVTDFALGDIWSRPGLNRRDRSLIVIATLGALNQIRQLKIHVRGAVNHGMSADEVREVAAHLCGYAGFPRSLDAMAATNEVLENMGFAPEDGKLAPAASLTIEERRKLGAERLSYLTAGAVPADPDVAIPALESQLGPLGRLAIEFLFAQVWTRDQLSLRDRSLLVVSVLTALGRKDELDIHIPGAINHGLSREELEELMLMQAAYSGFPFAVEGMRKLRSLLNL